MLDFVLMGNEVTCLILPRLILFSVFVVVVCFCLYVLMGRGSNVGFPWAYFRPTTKALIFYGLSSLAARN